MQDHDDGDHTMIMGAIMKSHIKGKRTKRRRPSPALTLTLASTSTTSSTANTASDTSSPPANHRGFLHMPATTSIEFTNNILQDNLVNTDHDIANCLMLLAHGQQLQEVRQRSHVVYECKTCDRGFTSFQALGGHKASHNKPHRVVHELATNKVLSCNNTGGSTRGPKVHECSICGAEFTSGQALGGHMRRHRSMTMASSMAATTCDTSNVHREPKKHKTVLPLDLNLPAPIDDDHVKETDNSFGSNNQIIVFSGHALVGCHL